MTPAATPPTDEAGGSTVAASPGGVASTPRTGSRARAVGLAAVLLVLVVWLVVARLQLTDPYRPGTSHAVTVRLHGCLRPEALSLDGRTWSSHDEPPAGWPNPPLSGTRATEVPGTLTVTDTDRATFTADQGGQVSFVRLPAGRLDSLDCPIR